MILIGDKIVRDVKIVESNEPIVDLRSAFPQLLFDLERRHVQKQSASISHARKIVGEKLVLAQSLLPDGIKLLLKECYRPMWVQKISWDAYTATLREQFPNWSDLEIYEEGSKLNAPLEVAPHTTGGAVDLTLIHAAGEWLDMGTDLNASPLQTQEATYTHALNITATAKENRQILSEVMTKAGFVNYPTEWWHWSFGDKYWALLSGQPFAIFGSLQDGTI